MDTLTPDLVNSVDPPPAPDAAALGPLPLDSSGPESLDPLLRQRPPQPDQSLFSRHLGETPRAFGAFLAWYRLGPARSLPAVAKSLGEKPATVKQWSCRFHWRDRLHACQSGLLQARLEAEAALERRHAADWAARLRAFREQQWAASQKLLQAVTCFLENFGDREVEKMTLAQVSRALEISSRLAWASLRGDHGPDEPAPSPLQAELEAALQRAYGLPAQPADPLPATASNPGKNPSEAARGTPCALSPNPPPPS